MIRRLRLVWLQRQLAQLGWCGKHNKPFVNRNVCETCLELRTAQFQEATNRKIKRRVALIARMQRLQNVPENIEKAVCLCLTLPFLGISSLLLALSAVELLACGHTWDFVLGWWLVAGLCSATPIVFMLERGVRE
jgi:hypothetical protein